MKIALVLGGGLRSGANWFLGSLGVCWVRQGHEVAAYAGERSPMTEHFGQLGVTCHCRADLIDVLPSLLWSFSPDLVDHACLPLMPEVYQGPWQVWGHAQSDDLSFLQQPQARAGMTGVVAISDAIADRLRAQFGERVTVIPNGVDTKVFLPSAEQRHLVRELLGFDQERPVVSWAGRMADPRKRLDVLREVVERLAPRGWQFIVCGDFRSRAPQPGDPQREWRAFAAGQPAVRWLPNLWPWHMPAIHAACDYNLSTSETEGGPLVSLEAAACGSRPVLTTGCGHAEAIGSSFIGAVVEPGDADAAAEALCDLERSDGERNDMRLTAARWARANGDLVKIAARHLALYRAGRVEVVA